MDGRGGLRAGPSPGLATLGHPLPQGEREERNCEMASRIQAYWNESVQQIARTNQLVPKFNVDSEGIVSFGFGNFEILRVVPRTDYFFVSYHNYDTGTPEIVSHKVTAQSIEVPVKNLLPSVLGDFVTNLRSLKLLGIV